MKKSIIASVLMAALAAVAGNAVNPDAVELAPIPLPIEFTSDMDKPVAFDAQTAVTLECADAAGVAWLNRHFAEWFGKMSPKVVAGTTGLALRPGDEAYAIAVDASGVKIAARTLAGVRWAAYTLRPLAIAKRGTFKTEGRILPTFTASDAPMLGFRCVHLCWIPPMTGVQIERAIRLAAMMKFNYVILEPWGMYKSEKNPWWCWPDAQMTKSEVRRMVAVARDLGVTMIPQINAYGHGSSARSCSMKHAILDLQPEYEPLFEPGGWTWCLTNPETQRVLRELIAELHEDFGNPPFFHLGCDEAQPPSCPECRKAPYNQLVCQHIAGLVDFVKSRNARAMIWHDMLLDRADPRWKDFVKHGSAETAKLADILPKDVIICDWEYSYGNMKEVRTDWPTIQYFKDKGFPVATCPWMNFRTMKPMADYVAKVGGFGFIETTWHHLRGSDWVNMYKNASAAAWGTSVPKSTPMFDTNFGLLLRLVGHDMKVTDQKDTGHLNYQIPPAWWVDNN